MAASTLFNMVRVASSTVGSGASAALDAAVTGFLDATAIPNATLVSYVIEDGAQRETGQGAVSSTGTALARTTVRSSTNGGARIAMSGSAEIYIDALKEDLEDATLFKTGTVDPNRLGSSPTSAKALFGDSVFRTLAAIAQSGSASDLASGTVPTGRLGSGTASAATFLAGDQSYKTIDALSTASGSAPSYSCRAWVNFNGTGTIAIRASGNVSSITDNGIGDYTANLTTAMPDANYGIAIAHSRTNSNTTLLPSCRIDNNKPPTASAMRFQTGIPDGVRVQQNEDVAYACVTIIR